MTYMMTRGIVVILAATEKLRWEPQVRVEELVGMMLDHDLADTGLPWPGSVPS